MVKSRPSRLSGESGIPYYPGGTNGGTWSTPPNGPVDIQEVLSCSDNKAPIPNTCLHMTDRGIVTAQKLWLFIQPYALNWKQNSEGTYVMTADEDPTDYAVENSEAEVFYFPIRVLRYADIPESTERELWASAYCSCLRILETDAKFNVFRSVCELKDVPQTLGQSKDLIDFIIKSYQSGKINGKAALVHAIGAYLAYIWAIKPTISDIKTVSSDFQEKVFNVETVTQIAIRDINTIKENLTREYVSTRRGVKFRDDKDPPLCVWDDNHELEFTFHYRHFHDVGNGKDTFYLGDFVECDQEIPSDRMTFGTMRAVISWMLNQASQEWPAYEFTKYSRAIAFCHFKTEDVANTFDKLDLGFKTLASSSLFKTAWNLVSLSFLVDWFSSMGKKIQNIQNICEAAHLGLTPAWGVWKSIRRDYYVCSPDIEIEKATPIIRYFEYPPFWDIHGDKYIDRIVDIEYKVKFYLKNATSGVFKPTGCFKYERLPYTVSSADLVVPRLELNIKPSSWPSLAALLASFVLTGNTNKKGSQ